MDKKQFIEEFGLNKEEQELLEKLEQKLQTQIQSKQDKQLDNIDEIMKNPKQLGDSPFHSKHITNYQREIIVHVDMEISAINDDGQLTEVGQVLENFYHIPVPSGVDYTKKIKHFMDKFDRELNNCAVKIHNNNVE